MPDIERLSAAKVRKEKRPGMYADGGGLYLQVQARPTDDDKDRVTRSWIFRYRLAGHLSRGGKPLSREMGLGSVDTFGLADARERARLQRQLLADGVDPIAERERKRDAERLAAAKRVTFRQAAETYVANKAAEKAWRNAKHQRQWSQTLDQYAYPLIGDLWVQDVDTALVLKILRPIWSTKTETANRLRGRIETVLNAAKADHHRTGENPAEWKNLKDVLGNPRKVKKANNRGNNHAALDYAEMPAFLKRLRAEPGEAAVALEFTIATAARTGEVIGARWSEIDFDYRDREEGRDGFAGPVWTIPASRMKSGREHRIPLTQAAAQFLRKRRPTDGGGDNFVFSGRSPGRPLSNMAMLVLLQRRFELEATVHGFRSSFRTWAAEETDTPRDIAEAALAHVVGDSTERAYQRGSLLKKRLALMSRWQAFIDDPKGSDNVVSMKGRGAS